MGISDEDYRAALIQQHMKAHLEYLEKQKEKEMSISGATGLGNLIGGMGAVGALSSNGTSPYQAQQAVSSNTYPSNLTGATLTSTSTNAVWTAPGMQGIKTINEQDLKHDAMQAPLSALVDMWQVRWSGEWVSETEFQDDDFWRLALIRLTGANKLEKHHLASQYAAVYRIIE